MIESLGEGWLFRQIDSLTDAVRVLRPSDWAEESRYLPPPNRFPGPFRFAVAPYMREPLDCLSIDSPIREVAMMKGVQVTATVGILENAIGYYIDHVKSAAVMMVTADSELAKLRMDSNVIPMVQSSGLEHLIQSSDQIGSRKTGKTDQKLEWFGGGFLIPMGARNANKMRSIPIQYLLRDEVDGWPDVVGKDGDPMQLTQDRTTSYAETRKILDLSTPLLKGSSKIHARYERGDKRKYHVRCKHCGYHQSLHWRHVDSDTGERTGIVWETQDGALVRDSVRYLCINCGGAHINEDKVELFDPDNGAEWVPTSTPVQADVRSYHLSGLYSPVGFLSWADQVQMWLEAYDDQTNQARNLEKLQVFYNNVLARPYELRGEGVKFTAVSGHRRSEYGFGSVPNNFALEATGYPIGLLICTVDVHKDNLAVAVHGFCRGERAFLIDYWRFYGDTMDPDDAGTWGQLRELIETKVYTALDGKEYPIVMTLVDAGYSNDLVTAFCAEYEDGVFPILGRDTPSKNQTIKEFAPFETQQGTRGFRVTVDLYKDRWSARLNRRWSGEGVQPEGTYNAPVDVTEDQLKELTREVKQEKIDKETNRRVGVRWHRPHGAAQELWDLLVYANAGLDLLAWDICRHQMDQERVDWPAFWALVYSEREPLFYREGSR